MALDNELTGTRQDISGVFTRREKKYPITMDKIDELMPDLHERMHEDQYGLSTVASVYYDTPSWRLIRESIEKPLYKEKLRLRSYGVPGADTTVFAEIKKKFSGIVYKRRVAMPYNEAVAFLGGKAPAPDCQIGREIEYFLQYYQNLAPMIMVIYDRLALFDSENSDIRVTFDTNIRYRMDDLSLADGMHGKLLLPEGHCIMEIKSNPFGMPSWLSRVLDKHKVYPGSFSKVGTAYTVELKKHLNLGGYANVDNASFKRHP